MIPKEFLGAFKAGHRKVVREFIDEELARRLLKKVLQNNCQESRRALEFIAKFNNEYYRNVIKKGDTTALHNTNELRLERSRADNARNRCVFTKVDLVYFSGEVNT